MMAPTLTLYRELPLLSAIWDSGFYFPLDNEIVVSITSVNLTSIRCQKIRFMKARERLSRKQPHRGVDI